MEQTLVIVKPDGVRRRLTGRILAEFEEAGLNLERIALLTPSRGQVDAHYPKSDDWFGAVGKKTLDDYKTSGRDPVSDLGTADPVEIGRLIKGWLIDYLTSGPVVVMILSGNEAVRNVRRICGDTIPSGAAPGTIRGRFSIDSAGAANSEGRPVHNLVHASGTISEAEEEITLWMNVI